MRRTVVLCQRLKWTDVSLPEVFGGGVGRERAAEVSIQEDGADGRKKKKIVNLQRAK